MAAHKFDYILLYTWF